MRINLKRPENHDPSNRNSQGVDWHSLRCLRQCKCAFLGVQDRQILCSALVSILRSAAMDEAELEMKDGLDDYLLELVMS